MKRERLRIELSTKSPPAAQPTVVLARLFVNDRLRYQVTRSEVSTGEAQSRAFWAVLHGVGYNYAPNVGLVRVTNRGTARLGVLVRVEGDAEDLSSLSTDDHVRRVIVPPAWPGVVPPAWPGD